MKRTALLVLTLTGSLGSAAWADAVDSTQEPIGELRQQPNGYIASGGILGSDRFDFHGVAIEAGHRVGFTPLFMRVMAHAGNTSIDGVAGRGTYKEARGGLEARTCTVTGRVCGAAGLDVGVHRASYRYTDLGPGVVRPSTKAAGETDGGDPLLDTFDSTVAVPRFTVDGGGRVRIRAVLELPQHLEDGARTGGFAVSLALGLGF